MMSLCEAQKGTLQCVWTLLYSYRSSCQYMKVQWRKTSSSMCLHMSQAWLPSSPASAPQECPAVSMSWLQRSMRTGVSICVTHDKVGPSLPVEIGGNGLVTACADWRHLLFVSTFLFRLMSHHVVFRQHITVTYKRFGWDIIVHMLCIPAALCMAGLQFFRVMMGGRTLGALQRQISLPRPTPVMSRIWGKFEVCNFILL